jgi:F-type H+-transporting ATPase subunit c
VAKKIVLMFFLVALVAIVQPALAADNAATGAGEVNKWIAIASAFGLGFAAGLCGIAQSIAFRSAAEAIGRNPGTADTVRGMLILGLAFIESLAIYVLLIAFMLYFKWA